MITDDTVMRDVTVGHEQVITAYYGLAVAYEGLGDLRQAVAAMRAYAHVADGDEQYRRKAEAAIWEWEAALTAKNNEHEE